MSDQQEPPAPADDGGLVDRFLEADVERRRRRQAGQDDGLPVELPDDVSASDRVKLARLLDCADRLEELAAMEAGRLITPTLDFHRDATASFDNNRSVETHIGGYRIEEQIASGGFGSVLLAFDEAKKRHVALKVPRPDIRLTHRLRERFLIEGRAAATLSHPNIVKVYETISEPVTAIVYEYCEGGTLTQRASPGQPTDETTSIQIVLRLADALQHAHTRGILHRDVKPGNVLFIRAGRPDDPAAVEIDGAHWVPKLGDFGLAKVIDDSVNQTRTGDVMGTPQFMAPEQAAGRVAEFGTHTDVFSLGAIFYWLLTGRPPFDGSGALQTLRKIEEEDPVSVRRIVPGLSPKTEAVCLKCLRKPIEARYSSAAALADDLRHLLNGEPVTARPPHMLERARIWVNRKPAMAMFAVMLPIAAIIGLLQQWNSNRSLQEYVDRLDATNQRLVATTHEAEDDREFAVLQQARYARLLYAADLQLAQRAFQSGDVAAYADALTRYIPQQAESDDRRGPEWQALWDLGHPPETVVDRFPSAVYAVRVSPDGRNLAACGADGTVAIYDTKTWERLQWIETGQGEVNYAAYSSDSESIASAGDDGTIVVWDWRSGEAKLRIEAYDDLAYCVQFYDGDGKLASGGRDPAVKLWDAATGDPIHTLLPTPPPSRVEQLDISADGQLIASASNDGIRRVWTLNNFQPVESAAAIEDQPVSSICLFRRDGEDWMLSGTLREESRRQCSLILEVVGHEDQRVLPIHFDGVQSVAVDSSGELAAAGDRGGRISIIDVNAAIHGPRWWNPNTIRTYWSGHEGTVYGLTMIDGGQRVISAGSDGKVSCWRPNEPAEGTRNLAHRQTLHPWIHAVVAGKRTIYVSDQEMLLYRWDAGSDAVQPIIDAETGKPLHVVVNETRSTGCFAADENHVYGRPVDGPVCCWAINDGQARLVWTAEIGDDFPGTRQFVLSADARKLAVGRQDNPTTVFIFDAATGACEKTFVDPLAIANGTRAIAFNASASQIAYGTDKDVFLGDLATGTQHKLGSHEGEVKCLSFVPHSPWLLSGGDDRVIRLWNVETGSFEREFSGHAIGIECLGTHSFGDRVVSTDEYGWVRIWSLREAMPLVELPPRSGQTWYATAGDRLIGVDDGTTLFLQELRRPAPLTALADPASDTASPSP